MWSTNSAFYRDICISFLNYKLLEAKTFIFYMTGY